MEQTHTSKEYSADFHKLSAMLSQLGAETYEQISDSLAGLINSDFDLLAKVRAHEKHINQHQYDINDITVRMIALRQPVGRDLRYLLVNRDAANEMERLGDYANNIAKWGKRALNAGGVQGFAKLDKMSEYVCKMLHEIIAAYEINDDAKQNQIALAVIDKDDALDDMYISTFRESLTYTLEDTKKITAFTHYMLILKQLERIGDLATNLAELLYYKNEGIYPIDEKESAD